ncbi:ATP-binding cassette, subfamily C, EexD [Oceanospirillum multiglobuliferum]|uniref:Type I secretion system permease/ATPase n=1 Tax=Oceanospirillum multiglobuliferum TaxID=64969 RepID=A0A1T4Q7X5_9GAMM|nr:type I secretion system permease/ATPase [Oceanospirillum multiglobuliferum]OPX56583.1 type I secretion system permease/ATPase [Oceanospirillum multiglobuliferum]SJZ99853.1 ATP-binding cassette, subfamily C, EexD [Oceanospirillum multiglobuliferum]
MNTESLASDLKDALRTSRKGFIAAGVFSLFINILMLTAPIYMLQVYDRVVAARSFDTLFYLTLIMVGMFTVIGLLEWVRSRVLVRIGNQLDHSLSPRVYSAMFEQGVNNPSKRNAQALSDLTSLRQFMTGNGLFAFFDAPWMPIYIGLLFVFHPAFGWFSVGAGVILLLVAILNEKGTRKPITEASTENIIAQNLANSNINNTEVLHAMGMLPNILRRWHQKHQDFLEKQTIASDKAGVYSNLSKILRMMFQSLILGLGAFYVIQNEMSPGMMIAGSILMGRALAPLDLLIGTWSGFNNARSAYGRLNQLLLNNPQNQRKMSLPEPKGTLSLENVHAIPPGSKTLALKAINISIPAGSHVGVVGPSAAGKSTLARVALGLWPIANGVVRLDGADINHYNRDELGPHIGYLPQDIELFEGTISENIARFGHVDSLKVVGAAQKAGVHELILALPDGYDTRIGSTTGALSGGQRQRIGLARALYGNPKFIVLDEPNSNLDDHGEMALANTMQLLKAEGTTVLVVSHRPSILRNIDLLLVLKEGAVQMFGSKEDVMQALAQQKQQQQAS